MRYRRLDLNLLVALDAVLANKSVTQAARKLNITQPAMSGALARLRDYFEDPLLIQVGRRLELTPLAHSLVEPIHEIMLRVDSAIALEPAFNPKQGRRHFVITASDYVIRVLLLEVLKDLSVEAPGLSFAFRTPSGRVHQELESGDVDFVIGPEIDVLPDHPQELLFEDTYVVLAWTGNTAVGDTLSFDDYLGLGHVVFGTEHHGKPWLERWFIGRYGEVRRLEVTASSFGLMPHLVIGTNRIATMQLRLARRYLSELPLKLVPAPLELPKLVEVLQWNLHRDMDPASRWFRSKLKEHADRIEPVGEA